jgi:hypothetical protein
MGATAFFNPAQTFYSPKGIEGPIGGVGIEPAPDTPPADKPRTRTAAQRRRHRRRVQRLRARRRRQAPRRHHARAVNRSGIAQAS